MPGFDRSGPGGGGPMTGGARGYCNPANAGFERPLAGTTGFGRGMAYGRGLRGGYGPGMGMRHGFGRGFVQKLPAYTESSADALNMLKAEAEAAKNVLETINRKITELEKIK